MTLPHPSGASVRALVLATSLATAALRAAPSETPLWAYGFTTPYVSGEKITAPGVPTHTLRASEDADEQTRKRTIVGSKESFSLVEIRNGHDVVDWFPGDHPPLTPIMRHGPASLGEKAYGCAFCHMPTGQGRPENAPVAGLSAAYFIRQMHDFKNGLRGSAEPRKTNTLIMVSHAQAMTDEEIKIAADYFAALSFKPWIRVVETDRVPRSKIVTNMFVSIEAERTEPLAGRIMEMPENADATELMRDPHSGFIAYVPIGSVRKGEALVKSGAPLVVDGKPIEGKTLACATCHGPELHGVAEIPGIAGRSPSYIARQLYDIQHGTRRSPLSQTMLPVVAHLTDDDLVAISAYVASLPPQE
jgi:cytochrome c553